MNRGGLTNGGLTQGYCEPNARILDAYSGPASCLWGTRSLVAAFTLPRDHAFWNAPELPLPVEQSDFEITIDAAALRLIGNRPMGSVTIRKLDRQGADRPRLAPYGWSERAAEWVFMRPFRPANRKAKYDAPEYSSDQPFCGCREPAATQARAPRSL